MAHLLSSGPFGEESEPSAGQWLRSFNNGNLLPLQSYLKVVGAPILMYWSSHFLFLYFSCFLNLLKRFRKPNLDFTSLRLFFPIINNNRGGLSY